MRVLKLIILFSLLLGITNKFLAQNTITGVFVHKDTIIGDEFITIKSDGTFWYLPKNHVNDCQGIWTIKGDTLTLNSYKQRVLVFEDYNRKSKDVTVWVWPSNFPNEARLVCNIFVLTEKGDTLSFYKTDKIKIKKRIKAFWIEEIETALKSKPYFVTSKDMNIFDVHFDKGKVFENENWLIIDEDNIKSIGNDKELNDYLYQRKE